MVSFPAALTPGVNRFFQIDKRATMPTTQSELGLLEGEYGMVATILRQSFYMLVLLLFQGLANATQEIVLWHSLEGPISEKFIEIVNKYNQKPENIQANIKV